MLSKCSFNWAILNFFCASINIFLFISNSRSYCCFNNLAFFSNHYCGWKRISSASVFKYTLFEWLKLLKFLEWLWEVITLVIDTFEEQTLQDLDYFSKNVLTMFLILISLALSIKHLAFKHFLFLPEKAVVQ